MLCIILYLKMVLDCIAELIKKRKWYIPNTKLIIQLNINFETEYVKVNIVIQYNNISKNINNIDPIWLYECDIPKTNINNLTHDIILGLVPNGQAILNIILNKVETIKIYGDERLFPIWNGTIIPIINKQFYCTYFGIKLISGNMPKMLCGRLNNILRTKLTLSDNLILPDLNKLEEEYQETLSKIRIIEKCNIYKKDLIEASWHPNLIKDFIEFIDEY